MRIKLDADNSFLVVILSAILQKIEGKIFVDEAGAIELLPDTNISITYDTTKRGWWVSLEGGDVNACSRMDSA